LLAKAATARQAQDRETEALALREAVEILGRRPPTPQLEAARKACVEAMVEAGGNADSYRLWRDLEQKNPASQEAQRMKQRAHALMLGQAGELSTQVQIDSQAGNHQSALCTAQAALSLLQQAEADPEQIAKAEAAAERARKRLVSESPSNTPTPEA
jgi:hypothetical protein